MIDRMFKISSRITLQVFILSIVFALHGQDSIPEREYVYAEENQKCLMCHGKRTFFFYNEGLGREVKERINPYFVIDSALFYQSNHWNFSCTDCHSPDYRNFPHAGELRMEVKATCLDCHGWDPTYSDYHFERIDEEFLKSVHSTKHSEDFTCSMCHNPHSYKINARDNANVKETIIYYNNICLSCHADIGKYQLITDKVNPNVLEKHDWLPNQALHFTNVRCIECHAERNDSILVAHNIQPKEHALKQCVECHSLNSMLMVSLYKYKVKESRNELGFFNAAVLGESYIIGANRNYYLNFVSILLFGFVIAGLLFHGVLRFLKK
jgi:Zn finger protein HypA/HybF involved in hydrogenase expression